MKHYRYRIFQSENMIDLIIEIDRLMKSGYSIDGKIKSRLRPAESVTGFFVIMKRRLSIWEWFKMVFWKQGGDQ